MNAEDAPRPGRPRDLLLLGALGTLTLSPFLGQTRRLASREIRHAEIAREMAENGDFLVPRLLGRPYRDKPPLLHAPAAALFRAAGGPSLGLARAPSVAAAVLAALFLYGIGCALADRRVALLASLGILGVPCYAHMARVARPDMIFTMGILLSCLGFARGMVSRRTRWYALAGLGCGLSSLAKGPLGLLFPLLFPLLVPFSRRDLRRPNLPGWLLFFASALGTAALWVVPVYLRDGGEHLRSVLLQPDLSLDAEDTRRGFLWYLPPLLASFLPLTLFLPWVAIDALRRRFSPALAVALGMLVVLAFVWQRRFHYLLPVYPFLSLAVAEAIVHSSGRRWILRSARGLIAFSLVNVPLYFGLVLPAVRPEEDSRFTLAREILERIEPGAPVISFGGMGEPLAFVGRRSRVWEARDAEALLAKIREEGIGTCLVLPEERRESALRGIEEKLSLTTLFERKPEGAPEGRRWMVYRVDAIAP